jgi:hypothetical protein
MDEPEDDRVNVHRDGILRQRSYVGLNRVQSHRISSSEATKEVVSDDRILIAYRWAREAKSAHKLNSRLLAAYIIVFEELLGLDRLDAVRTMKTIKDSDELAPYVRKIKTEKLSPP